MVRNSLDTLGRVEDVEDYDPEPRWPAHCGSSCGRDLHGFTKRTQGTVVALPFSSCIDSSVVSHHTGTSAEYHFGLIVDLLLTGTDHLRHPSGCAAGNESDWGNFAFGSSALITNILVFALGTGGWTPAGQTNGMRVRDIATGTSSFRR
jgi:hypothetical protein